MNQSKDEGLFTLGDIKARKVEWIKTGVSGFDEITGGGLPGAGGLVRNSLAMFAGRKGVGKSTLWTQIAGSLVELGETVLYVSGEEDLSQFAYRATKRLGLKPNANLLVTDRKDVEFIIEMAMKHEVDVIIIDSLPTIYHADTGAKVRVSELDTIKKTLNAAIVFVQHETKGNHIAGTAMDQHMVDIILKADPEWTNPSVRRLQVDKNRFAPVTHEMRYSMGERGVELLNLVRSDPFNDATKKQAKTRRPRNAAGEQQQTNA